MSNPIPTSVEVVRVYASLLGSAFRKVDDTTLETTKRVSGQVVRDTITADVDPMSLVGGGSNADAVDVNLAVGERFQFRTPATGGPGIVVKQDSGAKLAYLVRVNA